MDKKFKTFGKLIIKIVSDIHRDLGPGFTESVYQGALGIELRRRRISYLKEMSFDIFYKKQPAGTGRLDFFINNENGPNVIIETKSLDALSNGARSQIASYLMSVPKNHHHQELQKTRFGILINWPGAVVDEDKSFTLINKDPEIEFFACGSNSVWQVQID
jgi:hypothetical protein